MTRPSLLRVLQERGDVHARPRTRGDCADGPRPCPWYRCRHHLGLEVIEEREEHSLRVQRAGELISSRSRSESVRTLIEEFGVSPRQARRYVDAAMDLMVGDGAEIPPDTIALTIDPDEDEERDTCSLDVADRAEKCGGATLEEIATALGVKTTRAFQILEEALGSAKKGLLRIQHDEALDAWHRAEESGPRFTTKGGGLKTNGDAGEDGP